MQSSLLVWLLLTRTPLGLLIRAVMQNRDMAACMGVRTERVNMLTFGLGSGLAGLAGAFLSQLGNVGPGLGQSYIVDCFMTVVVGGVGNLVGTIYSALGIGVVDQALQPFLGPVMGKITVLAAIILFLQWKPGGLFPTTEPQSGRLEEPMAASEVRKFEIWGIAIAAVVILGVLPALNAFVPETNPLHVSNFTINLYGKYLTYAVLAIGVDVLWGFTGLLSLGQCLFFALGGYAFGMYLMLKIGKLGQYKSDLPDFMVFLGYNKLPAHWVPFDSFWFAVAAVILVPGIVALVFGYLAFRSRIRGVYFSILTQALTYGACLMFFRNDFTFGGNNGLTDFKFVLGYDVNSAATQRVLYILSGLLLFGAYVFSRWLTTTKFGKVQRAIRDSENRVLFSGYATLEFQAFRLCLRRSDLWPGRGPLHPSGRNYQSKRNVARKVP